jgi:hypothetical protein
MPAGGSCYPCVRYDLSPMSRAAHAANLTPLESAPFLSAINAAWGPEPSLLSGTGGGSSSRTSLTVQVELDDVFGAHQLWGERASDQEVVGIGGLLQVTCNGAEFYRITPRTQCARQIGRAHLPRRCVYPHAAAPGSRAVGGGCSGTV